MRLVKVFSSISVTEVNFVKSLLNASKIESVIFDEATASLAPHYLFHQNGPRLMVREEDRLEAEDIVKDYEESKVDPSDDYKI